MKKTTIESGHPPAELHQGATLDTRSAANNVTSAASGMRFRNVAGQRVPDAFYETVHGRVIDVLPILEPDVPYAAQDLCGHDFIARLSHSRQQQVDVCLADMAARGTLPLMRVQDEADGLPRYCLVGGAQ